MENRKFTPEEISELKENEVFVFGSNANGNHIGGAARIAVEKFGAIMGQAEGLQGQSYAIPTLDKDMKKKDIADIAVSVQNLYAFAAQNPNTIFYVTKIGCGIAGFSEIEMGDMFKKMLAPRNIILPKEFCVIKGYKVFNNDMTCRGFQYKEGNTFEMGASPELCEQGFHFCENPLDTRNYYAPVIDGKETHIHEVASLGDTYSDGNKSVTNKIKIGARLDIAGICRATFEYIRSRCTNEFNAEAGKPATAGFRGAATAGDSGAATAGDSGAATAGFRGAATAGFRGAATAGDSGAATAGDSGAATAGDSGAATAGNSGAATAGDSGAATAGFRGAATAGNYGAATAGNYGAATAGFRGAATAGDSGAATAGFRGAATAGFRGAATAGNYGAATAGFRGAATAGNYGAATSRGKSSTGENGLSVARGNNVMVRGGIGAILIIAEENEGNHNIKDWKATVVDGERIKANTWYMLKNGKFQEVE